MPKDLFENNVSKRNPVDLLASISTDKQTINQLPEGIRKSLAWNEKKPIPKALDVIGNVIGAPKRALEKQLRGEGVTGAPQTPEEELAKLRYDNPYLYPLARVVAESPAMSKKVQRAGKSAANIVKDINEGWLPSAAGGFLQSNINAPISVLNAPLKATNLGEIPYVDLKKYKPSDTLASDMGFAGGQFGGYLAPYSKLNKMLTLGKRPAGVLGLVSDIVRGGGVGYLLGGEEGDLGRYLGGAAGALFEPLASVGSSRIAKRVVDKRNLTREHFNKRYTDIFTTAEKNNIGKLGKTPNISYGELDLFRKSKFGKSMDKFLQNPTIKNAHDFQSDLGKYANNLDKATVTRPLSSAEINILPKILDAQKRVRGSLFQQLGKSKDLGSKYQKVTQDYDKYGTTYRNKAIKEYIKGERTAARLVQYLNTAVKSEAKIKPDFPEIGINQALKKYAPWLTAGGAFAAAGGYLGKKAYGALHDNEE